MVERILTGDYILINEFIYVVININPKFDAVSLRCIQTGYVCVMSFSNLLRSNDVKSCGKLAKLLYSNKGKIYE